MFEVINFDSIDIDIAFQSLLSQIRMFIDPVTKCQFAYTPFGRIIHTPPLCPRTDWANDFGRPWWKNESYCIGLLSQKTRKVRIVNTLTSQEQVLEVIFFLFFIINHIKMFSRQIRKLNVALIIRG